MLKVIPTGPASDSLETNTVPLIVTKVFDSYCRVLLSFPLSSHCTSFSLHLTDARTDLLSDPLPHPRS